MRKILDNEIAPFGIGHAEMRLLMLLYTFEKCTQDELTSRLEVDRSNVGRALKKLVDLGYVTRVRDRDDGRLFRIFLTEKGVALKEPLFKIKHNIELTIGAQVDDEEIKVLIGLLSKVEKGITEENYNLLKSME